MATVEQMMPVIVQRLGGSLTAVEAARRLGISRKSYYQWEQRALRGMQQALTPGPVGRPASTCDPVLGQMEVQNQQLQKQVELLEQRLRVREILNAAETRAKKK